ncbi:hypothetical protein, partial [Rhodovulum sulfidophilum]|uniref:hypothetical protein n=1 Tax=Rhodovulum sulfidophilum TaxID=35806 RepID=UPI001F40135C
AELIRASAIPKVSRKQAGQTTVLTMTPQNHNKALAKQGPSTEDLRQRGMTAARRSDTAWTLSADTVEKLARGAAEHKPTGNGSAFLRSRLVNEPLPPL